MHTDTTPLLIACDFNPFQADLNRVSCASVDILPGAVECNSGN